jgi:hypothetical protein
VLPAWQRLATALEASSQAASKIGKIMHQAEDDAAAIMRTRETVGALPGNRANALGGNGGSAGTAAGVASVLGQAGPGSTAAGGQSAPIGGASSSVSSRIAAQAPAGGPIGSIPGHSAYKSRADGAGSGVVGRVLKNFSPEVRELAAKSPTLLKNLEFFEKAGGTLRWGSDDKGTSTHFEKVGFKHTDGSRLVPVIEMEPGHSAEAQVDALAHETGHVLRGPSMAVWPTDMSHGKAEWVKQQVTNDLDGEGRAVMDEAVVREEILNATGTDIGDGKFQPGDPYLKIYQDFKSGQETWTGAIHQMGQLYAHEQPSGTPKGTTYREYYTKSSSEAWDDQVSQELEERDDWNRVLVHPKTYYPPTNNNDLD